MHHTKISSSSASSSSLVKEKDADSVVDKKRRKASNSSSSITTGDSPAATVKAEVSPATSREDTYANVVAFEKQESERRSADTDSEMFHETCADLRQLFAEIAQAKLKAVTSKVGGGATTAADKILAEKRIEGSYLFVLMKKLNRMDKIRLRAGRDALHKEKLAVDSNRLQLQNLLYEAEHLRKEVQRCFQFKSQDEQIELVDEAEFYAEAPVEISRPEKTRDDEHARRLARLDWELQQRKELAVLCEQLERQKEVAAQHIETKTQRLDSLGPCLDALLKATRPLQEALDMNIEDEWKVNKIARLLPPPLYMVYANLTAFAEACDPQLSATINGDEFEANQLEDASSDVLPKTASSSSLSSSSTPPDEDEAMESDNDDDESRPSKKSHHHRRQTKAAQRDQQRDRLFKPHPLSVTFAIHPSRTPHTSSQLNVTLYYLTNLNIVTAKCGLQLQSPSPTDGSEVISTATILNGLVAGDSGTESCNPKTHFQLREIAVDPSAFAGLLLAKDLGKPYRWAQQLCGLDFVSTSAAASGVSLELTQAAVPQIVRQIRNRWLNRLELLNHIQQLARSKVTTTSNNSASGLIHWAPITFAAYTSQASAQRLVEQRVVTEDDLLYSCVVARGADARLDCVVRISVQHPVELPLWAITLHRKADSWTAQTMATVREMESWINAAGTATNNTSDNSSVLEQQLRRAQSCLDIYLETESSEFGQEKTFLRAFRCRSRSRPFKVIQTGASSVYTQV